MRRHLPLLSALLAFGLAPTQASATYAGAGLGKFGVESSLQRVDFGGCPYMDAAPCLAPVPFVQPYPIYQRHVVPFAGYRPYVVHVPVNPCSVHVWDVPYPCRKPEPIELPPCSPCGGYIPSPTD